MSVAVMVGKLVLEWYPSTTGPRLPTMTDSLLAVPSNLSVPKVPEPNQAATSAHAKKGPKPGEYVQLFRMIQDHNNGFL